MEQKDIKKIKRQTESDINNRLHFNFQKYLRPIAIIAIISIFMQCVIYRNDPTMRYALTHISLPIALLITIGLICDIIFKRKE